MKIFRYAIIILFLVVPAYSHAQNDSLWYVNKRDLKPVNTNWGIVVPRSTSTQATSTSLFSTAATFGEICFSADICRTTWPSASGGGGGVGWTWNDVNLLRMSTTTDDLLLGATATSSRAKLNVHITGTNPAAYFNGNVGIGTTTPYAPLSVFGEVVSSYWTSTSTTATSTSAHGVQGAGLKAVSWLDADFLTSAIVLTGAGGDFAEYTGTICTNQFVRVFSALGVATCATVDISADTNLTAGDALTLTDDDIDFDGGATPSGDLGGTWASPSVTDDSHAHTSGTLSGIDISADTNLTAGDNLTLTDDDIDLDATLTGLTKITTQFSSTTDYASFLTASSTNWTGGGLTDCDADNQTVSYDSTTQKFGCGDDDNSGGSSIGEAWRLISNGDFLSATSSPYKSVVVGATTTASLDKSALFQVNATGTTGTIIKASTTPSFAGNIFLAEDTTGADLFKIAADGATTIAGALTLSSNLTFDSETLDSLTDDATLANNSGDLQVVDVTCTDCLNATEIEDIYLLIAGDTSSGTYTMSGAWTFDTQALTVNSSVALDTNGVTFDTDGDGALTILGASTGADESIIFNLDDTTDEIVISSGSGAATTTFSGLAVQADRLQIDSNTTGVSLDTDGDGMLIIQGTANGTDEDLRLNLDDTSNTIALTSTTGVTNIDYGTLAIAGALGAVGTPGYSFTGDLNTGLWSPGADSLSLAVGGAEIMRSTLGLFTGIGTTTPQWLLQLASSTRPQLTLSDSGALTSNHWSLRNAGGILYFATSSPSTYATGTNSMITLNGVTGTTTISSGISATSTTYIYSTAANKGGSVVLEDHDGAGCTEIFTLNGTVSGRIVTCPNEI